MELQQEWTFPYVHLKTTPISFHPSILFLFSPQKSISDEKKTTFDDPVTLELMSVFAESLY